MKYFLFVQEERQFHTIAISTKLNKMQVENIGDTSSSFRTNRWRINNPCHIYNTVTTTERMNVIADINTGNLRSECKSGKINKWWTCKHHPNEEIPKNIYLLGGGMTLKSMHEQYQNEHNTSIEYKEFLDYTRELIKQGILY